MEVQSPELQKLQERFEACLNFDELPSYIELDANSRSDFDKQDLFHSKDRRYIQKIIDRIVGIKINNQDDSIFKFKAIFQQLRFPVENGLIPKRTKVLRNATRVEGHADIPEHHIRIRINKRSRMIIGLKDSKIVIIITDDHSKLK